MPRPVLFVLLSLPLSACADLTAYNGPAGEAGESPSGPDGADTGDDTRDETGPGFELVADASCVNPCTFRIETSSPPARVTYAADGWDLGESRDADSGFAITYDFNTLGDRYIEVLGFDDEGSLIGDASAWVEVLEGD